MISEWDENWFCDFWLSQTVAPRSTIPGQSFIKRYTCLLVYFTEQTFAESLLYIRYGVLWLENKAWVLPFQKSKLLWTSMCWQMFSRIHFHNKNVKKNHFLQHIWGIRAAFLTSDDHVLCSGHFFPTLKFHRICVTFLGLCLVQITLLVLVLLPNWRSQTLWIRVSLLVASSCLNIFATKPN